MEGEGGKDGRTDRRTDGRTNGRVNEIGWDGMDGMEWDGMHVMDGWAGSDGRDAWDGQMDGG